MAFEKWSEEAHFMAVAPKHGTEFVRPSFTDSLKKKSKYD